MKLKPSTIASAVIFLLTGIYTISFYENDFYSNLPLFIKIVLFSAVLINAAYYYYIEVETELDNAFQIKLKDVHKVEWWIRVLNQTILFSLWFLLQLDSLTLFAIALFFLFFSYLIWDIVAYSCFENNILLVLDIAGFVFTILFIWLGYVHFNSLGTGSDTDESRQTSWNVIWGACIFVYTLIPLTGVLYKHTPKFITDFIYKRKSNGADSDL
jgi:hypothetical protein